MKKLFATFALSALTFTLAHAQITLTVTGPQRIRPGESFTLDFIINWSEGFFIEGQGFTGIEYFLHQFPAHFGNEITLTNLAFGGFVNHMGDTYEFFNAQSGRLGSGSAGFSLAQSDFSESGTLIPPLLTASLNFTTTENLGYGNYRFTTDIMKTFFYVGSEYNIREFDHIQDFYLNVSAVPEPSTYAAGIGIIALIATAVIRRRNKRSLEIAYIEGYRDAA